MPLLGRKKNKDDASQSDEGRNKNKDDASQSDDDAASDNMPPRSKSKKKARGGTKDDAQSRSAKSKSKKQKNKDASETSSEDENENTKSKKKPKQRSSTGKNQLNAKKSNASGRKSTDDRRNKAHSEESDFENAGTQKAPSSMTKKNHKKDKPMATESSENDFSDDTNKSQASRSIVVARVVAPETKNLYKTLTLPLPKHPPGISCHVVSCLAIFCNVI